MARPAGYAISTDAGPGTRPFFIRTPDRDDKNDDGQEDEELPDCRIWPDLPSDRAGEVEDHLFGIDADRGPEP